MLSKAGEKNFLIRKCTAANNYNIKQNIIQKMFEEIAVTEIPLRSSNKRQ